MLGVLTSTNNSDQIQEWYGPTTKYPRKHIGITNTTPIFTIGIAPSSRTLKYLCQIELGKDLATKYI